MSKLLAEDSYSIEDIIPEHDEATNSSTGHPAWSSPLVISLSKAIGQINNYFMIIYICLGVPFNLISLVIFSRLTAQTTAKTTSRMGLLHTAQSAFNLLTILITFFFVRGSTLVFGGVSLIDESDALCKLSMFMRRYPLHVCSWMAVLVTFDRFVYVLYQQRFRFMRKRRVLAGLIGTILVSMAFVDAPNFAYYLTPDTGGCVAETYVIIVSNIISILMRTYVPLALMLVFNVIMIRKKVAKKLSLQQQPSSDLRRRRKEHQFTVSVMSFDFLFILTHFPLSVFYIVYDVKLYSNGFQNEDPSVATIYFLVLNVLSNWSLLNQTFAFFVYVSFNKIFRKELNNCALHICSRFFYARKIHKI